MLEFCHLCVDADANAKFSSHYMIRHEMCDAVGLESIANEFSSCSSKHISVTVALHDVICCMILQRNGLRH